MQAYGKIAARIDIGIAETLAFLADELALARHILNDPAAHLLRQTAVPRRTSRELVERLQCHAGAPQKHRADRILSGKLCGLRREKVNPFDHITLCYEADAPDKPRQVGEEPFRIRRDRLGRGVPLSLYTCFFLQSQELHEQVRGDPANSQFRSDLLAQDALPRPGRSADQVDHSNSPEKSWLTVCFRHRTVHVANAAEQQSLQAAIITTCASYLRYA